MRLISTLRSVFCPSATHSFVQCVMISVVSLTKTKTKMHFNKAYYRFQYVVLTKVKCSKKY